MMFFVEGNIYTCRWISEVFDLGIPSLINLGK